MPGARTRTRPPPATECSVSDEASQLKLYLQRQLEDDIARIFDESIYPDLEVVCGKLKILTHSCILKARTNQFYHKLQTVLRLNISRDTFDEIYSFVSDAYTECNIKYQEQEIIAYIDTCNSLKSVQNSTLNGKSDFEEADVFVTPTCDISLENTFQNLIGSPSTGLTKEYYALVPIDGNILEKELKEQDVLSNAFKSMNQAKLTSLNKPNSLSLTEIISSHISKTVKHSNSCDTLINTNNKCINIGETATKELDSLPSQTFETTVGAESQEKEVDSTYTPDSLIIDDPSSSSDYLSAALTLSPGVTTSGPQTLNVRDMSKMEQNFTSSDSGLDNTGLLESLNSHKDITLTDVSLTESTLHDLVADDLNESVSSLSLAEKNQLQRLPDVTNTASLSGSSGERDSNGQKTLHQSKTMKDITAAKSSKEEKQRQNEEIVILESSSLSSETGSWESIFPPKINDKNICQKFIIKERQSSNFGGVDSERGNRDDNICPSLVQKSPYKSTSCFIDASSLVDEEDSKIQIDVVEGTGSKNIPAPSQPIHCSTVRPDISPNDWSEGNEHDDSLELPDNKDPDSIQKDLSPTIFDMTPITEDSLHTNTFEKIEHYDSSLKESTGISEASSCVAEKDFSHSTNTVYFSSTPNNSIMSLKVSEFQQLKCQENDPDLTTVTRESYPHLKISKKFNEASPIVSGGASVEDHLPHMGSNVGSPLTRRKIENIPIVSGAYIPEIQETTSSEKKMAKSCINTSAWVVDMSAGTAIKKPGDRTCDILKNESKYGSLESCNKSRSSIDSDLSEKSSQKFYIDLSTLPDPSPPKNDRVSESAEKRNIFSMYIDFSDKSKPKEMPSRLSLKKNAANETKCSSKNKSGKASSQIIAPNGDVSKTFEEYESLCNDPNITVSEIIERIGKEKNSSDKSNKSMPILEEEIKDKQENTRPELPKVTEKEVAIDTQTNSESFVKLSDLDKPVHHPETSVVVKVTDVRMTRSIPDTTWGENNAAVSRSIEVISSFHSENALSLNRLFPHLKNEFSRSMPGSLSARTRSPLRLGAAASPNEKDELNEVTSDNMSEISSVQSSVCRSVVENSTTEETSQTSSLIGNCQSRLGQDLLRMFLEEIAPDVIVEVSGKRIKAHKCILSSRCQYFAGILSGGWVESAGNVIVLPPFSFNVVHFALCHIYSGVSTIPDSISIVELATIADMLGLEGLKEAIMFTLKSKYCHHFHKPCPVCTAGVLECFPLSSVYGLEDLYRKCLRWITKYFPKVWPTKAFATLPKELLDKCYQQHIVNLNTDNLIDTVYGCGITAASLQNARWAEVVARMCRRLVSAAAQYAAARLSGVLRALAALPPDAPAPPPPAHQALDDCFAAAIEWAPPEEACRAYAFLSALLRRPESNGGHFKLPQNNLLYGHASGWRLQCESALVRAAPRVVTTQAFKDLPPDLRKRLRELGCIMYGTQALPNTSSSLHDKKSRNPYKSNKAGTSVTRSLDIDQVRASFVPYASKPSIPLGSTEILKSNNDVRDRRATRSHPPKIRTTKAQEERAKYNLTKNNQSQDRLDVKAAATRLPYETTKPRYLEPKLCKESVRKTPKKIVPNVVSSSESSRNSRSPIQARSARGSRTKQGEARAPAPVLSQDSLSTCSRPRTAEPCTDSLSESQKSNKYATYTKTRHTTTGSIDSVNSCKVPAPASNHKMKTKIPVYSNHAKKAESVDKQQAIEPLHSSKTVANSSNVTGYVAGNSHRFGSLMNATKSSSAKMVPKIVRDSPTKSPRSVRAKRASGEGAGRAPPPPPPQPDIPPAMERSGTFLKDEPTFGDKTMNIDIDHPNSYNVHVD